MIAFEGHASGDVDNVLFNVTGLIDSGLTVTGLTSGSELTFSFTEDSAPLATPSAGQARVAGLDGATFNWLKVMPNDPLTQFFEFEANVNLSVPAAIRITAFGSSSASYDFVGGNGENRFAVTADGGDWISWVLIQTVDDSIADLRQIRIGSASAEPQVQAVIATPEPGTLIMLATGLFALARRARRKVEM
jgi:hypothetical protein